jgi:hypothetical protein
MLIASIAVAGCGGGGGSSTVSTTTVPPTGSFTASFSFALPTSSPASAARKPTYISASSRSLVINIAYAGSTVPGLVLNLNPLPANCADLNGITTCTATVVAQSSARSFIVSFFDQLNGQGHALSTATIPVPAAPGGVAQIDLVLDGVVATVGLALNGLVYGVPGTGTLTVTPYDADGNVIGGTAPYSGPITLSTSSTALTLSPTTVTTPGQAVTVTYNGAQDITLKVIAQPQGSAPVTLTPFGPTSVPPSPLTGVPPLSPALTQLGPATVSVTEAGYRGTYTITSSNTQVVTVTSPVTSVSDTTAIPISAVGAGSSTITVSDTNDQSATFAVTVTLTPVTIQGIHRR